MNGPDHVHSHSFHVQIHASHSGMDLLARSVLCGGMFGEDEMLTCMTAWPPGLRSELMAPK